MLEKLRQKLLAFIYSQEDVPALAGFSVGFYLLLFYYSKNFALANSLLQLAFFTAYYIVLPVAVLWGGYLIVKKIKLEKFKRHFLFIGMISFFSFYLIQLNSLPVSKKLAFGIIFIVACIVSKWLKGIYKLFVILLFLMSLFNLKPLLKAGLISMGTSSEWKKQPDGIENATFKSRPNIYYIQPDGYASFNNLKNHLHNFENSDFEGFLTDKGFTLYRDYRSNYFSTLLSNASMFAMKHHYIQEDVSSYGARKAIISDNAVLKTLKNNGYKTIFLTEKPYLLMNRPYMGYDYCNISYGDIPFIKDGWADNYDVQAALKDKMAKIEPTGHFFFIEKFSPGHIHGFKQHSEGVEKEKEAYLASLSEGNIWLKEVISHIEQKDPSAIIVIGADHGGFIGFEYALQSLIKTDDKDLINSVFGAALAIKWNSEERTAYDKDLKSAVNLFRTVFSFLSEEKTYLEHTEDNSSYIFLSEPKGLYRYINDKGEVVFEKANHVQN